jgi:16S rRNA (cytosine1402-N4)-methyltransferase
MVHIPVMLSEVLKLLDIQPKDSVVDATIGSGGHSKEICKMLGKQGKLVGIDADRPSLKIVKKEIQNCNCNVILKQGNFRNLLKILRSENINYVDKILFDLGLSSRHIEVSRRGFSFLRDEALIMTYDNASDLSGITAARIINSYSEQELERIIRTYGEEKRAQSIAKAIVVERKKRNIISSLDLANLVLRSLSHKSNEKTKLHPATKTFQALRIVVNDELHALQIGLEQGWTILNPQGRMAIITFNSLEDRIVKKFFKELQLSGKADILTKKPMVPSKQEISNNPRSRSAKLRVAMKHSNYQ